MDLNEIIRIAVNDAVKEAICSIKVENKIIEDRWLNGEEAMKVLGVKRSALNDYRKKNIIKQNKLGFYKYSELLNIK